MLSCLFICCIVEEFDNYLVYYFIRTIQLLYFLWFLYTLIPHLQAMMSKESEESAKASQPGSANPPKVCTFVLSSSVRTFVLSCETTIVVVSVIFECYLVCL